MAQTQRQAFLEQFGRRVHASRTLAGLTLQACADAAGMSYSNLSRVEHGKRSLYVENLAPLATVLGVSADYLLGLSEQMRRAN